MKTKPRASKAARKPEKKKPAAKTVARPRATAARSKKAPARKKTVARGPGRAAAKAHARTKTKPPPKKRSAARKTARKASNGRRANGRVPTVRVIGKREAWKMFDRAARKYTRMTGKEFIEWWNRGEFEKDPDDIPGVMDVAMLLPFVEES